LRQGFSCQQGSAEFSITFAAREGSYKPWWKTLVLEVHGMHGDEIAELKDKRLATRFDKETSSLVVELPDIASAASVKIRL
jgi:alpha-glucosidase